MSTKRCFEVDDQLGVLRMAVEPVEQLLGPAVGIGWPLDIALEMTIAFQISNDVVNVVLARSEDGGTVVARREEVGEPIPLPMPTQSSMRLKQSNGAHPPSLVDPCATCVDQNPRSIPKRSTHHLCVASRCVAR